MKFQIYVGMTLSAEVPVSRMSGKYPEERESKRLEEQVKKLVKEHVRKKGFRVSEWFSHVMLPSGRG